jgi:energy-coupling factor transporter ATP-binding protein EcfA2
MDGLARVNLIVGANNSGKTSLLEAIYLLVNQNDPERSIELLTNRGEVGERFGVRIPGEPARRVIGYQVAHMFHGRQTQHQVIELRSKKDHPVSLKIRTQNISGQQRSLFTNTTESESETPVLEIVFQYGHDQEVKVPLLDDGSVEPRAFRFLPKESSPHRFLTTNNLDFDDLAKLWDSIHLTAEEDKVVEALRILEPKVERIGFTSRQTSNTGIRVKLRDQQDPVPLGSMGDGMRRILTLATSTITAENGVLLVDEIDTGLYYRTQSDMWRLLIETADRLNVQIFATTHSQDCVKAFQETLNQLEDKSIGKLFRLSLRDGFIHPIAYNADELYIAESQSIEVR